MIPLRYRSGDQLGVANTSTRFEAGTSTDFDRKDRESERSALSARAARFHPVHASLHVSAVIGRIGHHPRIRREQAILAQFREIQHGMLDQHARC